MLHREPPAHILDLHLPLSAAAPSFPGLISSLRPIKRLTAQLGDEATLLRRFTYKHRNQHKGHGWWKRVVEMDRTAARALDEVAGWLSGLGYSDGKDEAKLLTREVVCAGLLRLPRVMLVVEKNVAVLLKSAGIFEQLVDSRAFLAFALVVVALAARLHALFTALYDECSRTTATLLRLVESNQLMATIKTKLDSLPRTLRRFLPLDPASVPSNPLSIAPSQSATPRDSPAPIMLDTADELGAAVDRKTAMPRTGPRKNALLASASPAPERTLSDASKPVARPITDAPDAPIPAKKVKRRAAEPSARTGERSPSSLFPFPLDTTSPVLASLAGKGAPSKPLKPKRARTDERSSSVAVAAAGEGGGTAVKRTKKVKKPRGGDEIDAIFG